MLLSSYQSTNEGLFHKAERKEVNVCVSFGRESEPTPDNREGVRNVLEQQERDGSSKRRQVKQEVNNSSAENDLQDNVLPTVKRTRNKKVL